MATTWSCICWWTTDPMLALMPWRSILKAGWIAEGLIGAEEGGTEEGGVPIWLLHCALASFCVLMTWHVCWHDKFETDLCSHARSADKLLYVSYVSYVRVRSHFGSSIYFVLLIEAQASFGLHGRSSEGGRLYMLYLHERWRLTNNSSVVWAQVSW